jgi:hypothetical protein
MAFYQSDLFKTNRRAWPALRAAFLCRACCTLWKDSVILAVTIIIPAYCNTCHCVSLAHEHVRQLILHPCHTRQLVSHLHCVYLACEHVRQLILHPCHTRQLVSHLHCVYLAVEATSQCHYIPCTWGPGGGRSPPSRTGNVFRAGSVLGNYFHTCIVYGWPMSTFVN